MESLRENRLLMYAIGMSAGIVCCLAFGLSPDILYTFEIVEFPEDVSFFFLQNVLTILNWGWFSFVVPQNLDWGAPGRYCFRICAGPSLFIPFRRVATKNRLSKLKLIRVF